MFSTVYRVTQKDFYARPYTSMWATIFKLLPRVYQQRRSYCLAPLISGFDTIRIICMGVY